jgi:hypothetical protein
VYLYFEGFVTEFTASLWHRLGFSYNQVAYEKYLNMGTDDVLRFIKHPQSGNVLQYYTINYGGYSFTEAEFAAANLFMFLKSSWGTGYVEADGSISSNRMVGDTGISNYIAYESPCSYLLLKSDLVNDFSTIVLDENSNTYISHKENILQKIDVDVNIYSYLHFKSNHSDAYKHTLSGKPITRFNLELCDDHGDLFSKNHHKTYSCVLKFEIEENNAIKDLNEQQIQLNHKLQYNSRHIC